MLNDDERPSLVQLRKKNKRLMAKFAQRTPAEHPLLGSVENFGLGGNSSLGRKFWVRVKILLGSKILVLGEKICFLAKFFGWGENFMLVIDIFIIS